jgi:hypothetical protein
LQWFSNDLASSGVFPQYYRHAGDERIAVAATDVPAETHLQDQKFQSASPGAAYVSPNEGAWTTPGPKAGPFTVNLADGSKVTYYWYRFIDQPCFQQYNWSPGKKARLQAFVEKLHTNWPIDREYMSPPDQGTLATLDPALVVTPPKGMEAGYVPIATAQSAQ